MTVPPEGLNAAQKANYKPGACPICGRQMRVTRWISANSFGEPPSYWPDEECPEKHLEGE